MMLVVRAAFGIDAVKLGDGHRPATGRRRAAGWSGRWHHPGSTVITGDSSVMP